MRLTWPEVSARRLARNHLATPADDPVQISADVLGIHAQVMSAAEMSICVRTRSKTRSDVRDALWRAKTLVKTRGPRGTVHLLAADDLPMWTGALSALPYGRSPYPDEVRMTAEQTDQVVEAIADAVAEAELTVDELTDAIVERVGPWAGERVMEAFQDKWPRWRQIENVAANRGALCFGPDRGRRTTYTSPRRWLPGFAPAPAEAALSELVRRFLQAYGPATSAQFARWLGAPPGWTASLFDRLPDLETVDFDGSPAMINKGDVARADAAAGLRLLPYFDAYGIACHPRSLLFPGRAADRALSGGQAGNIPLLLIDGEVGGVWHQKRSGNKIAVGVEPLTDLTFRQRKALDAEVGRIGEILQGTPTLTIGPITVGAHA
jgi:hypothetical protein